MKKSKVFLLGMFLAILMIFSVSTKSEASKAELNKKSLTMNVGQQKQLKVKNIDKKVVWTSSNKKVASVSEQGLVTAKKEGAAKIVAKIGKRKMTCKVQVKEAPILSESRVNLCVGKKHKLVVSGTAKKIVWRSSDKKIVKVSSKGVLRGLKKGEATITAKVGKKKLECKVKVRAAIKNIHYTFKVDNTDVLEFVYYSDSVSCQVADESIAKVTMVDCGYSVDDRGNVADLYVYGLKNGETTLTIRNNCTSQKITLRIVVKKPKSDTPRQQLIDYIIKNGTFDEFGALYVTKNETLIVYDGLEDYLDYYYRTTVDGRDVEWCIMEDYFTLWINGKGEEAFITAPFDKQNYQGEKVEFGEAWFGTPAKEDLQVLGNEITVQALTHLSDLLGEANLSLKDIGFLKYEG